MPKQPILIVGGSLGGLLAANMLHRAGFPVLVFERSGTALAGRGAGIVTHPELFHCLKKAGIDIGDSIGVKVPGRVTLAQSGDVVLSKALPQTLTAWSRLYRLLKDALPPELYRFDSAVSDFAQDSEGVMLQMADGSAIKGCALIAADGIRSTIRARISPSVRPQYAGYIAWRGLAEERNLSASTHSALFERFAFCLPPGEQMLGYPVAGADDSVERGGRRYNFVWYRPADAENALPGLLTDENGQIHSDGIAPGLIRGEVRRAMLDAAAKILSPQFREIVEKSEQTFFQPIFDLESPCLAFGRAALIGDAAFVARPHCGMGVAKAAADALALTEMIAAKPDDIVGALQDYNSIRQPIGQFFVNHARKLGAYMQAQLKTPDEKAMAEIYRTPEAVMRETAVPPAV